MKLTEEQRDAVQDALEAREPYPVWSEDDELDFIGWDGTVVRDRTLEWWAGHMGHPLSDGPVRRCKTCGIGASCEFDIFTTSLVVSILRELSELGLLRPVEDAAP